MSPAAADEIGDLIQLRRRLRAALLAGALARIMIEEQAEDLGA